MSNREMREGVKRMGRSKVEDNELEVVEVLPLWRKILWVFVAMLSFFWIFLPEPSDAIPFLGWLDEGFAFALFLYALRRLGVGERIIRRFLRTR